MPIRRSRASVTHFYPPLLTLAIASSPSCLDACVPSCLDSTERTQTCQVGRSDPLFGETFKLPDYQSKPSSRTSARRRAPESTLARRRIVNSARTKPSPAPSKLEGLIWASDCAFQCQIVHYPTPLAI